MGVGHVFFSFIKCLLNGLSEISVDTGRSFNVYKTSIDVVYTTYRRWNDVACLLGYIFTYCGGVFELCQTLIRIDWNINWN